MSKIGNIGHDIDWDSWLAEGAVMREGISKPGPVRRLCILVVGDVLLCDAVCALSLPPKTTSDASPSEEITVLLHISATPGTMTVIIDETEPPLRSGYSDSWFFGPLGTRGADRLAQPEESPSCNSQPNGMSPCSLQDDRQT